MRTQGVAKALLRRDAEIAVEEGAALLAFRPVASSQRTGLIFICGSGVAAEAYAPLLRPVAKAGHAVYIASLPWRFAFTESQRQAAVDCVLGVIAEHPEVAHWVVAGHSLGAALACRVGQRASPTVAALVLLGSTHPKREDLSALRIPVTKVYASNDGVAPRDRVLANRGLLPATTRWVEIEGGNHSQFGHYGHQLRDGTATISREAQQAIVRGAILEALATAEE